MLVKLDFSRRFVRNVLILSLISIALLSFATIRHASAQSEQVVAKNQHLVTIYDRDQQKVIMTGEKTIGDALRAAGVSVDKEDRVEPAVDEEMVATNYHVNIYRARPVVIIDGSHRHKVVSAYQTPSHIASEAGITVYPEDSVSLTPSHDIAADGMSMRMTIKRATSFTFLLYGKKIDARTNSTTVGAMLKEKNIKLGPDDTVSIPQNTAISAGMTVEVWRNGTQTVTEDQDVEFPVEKIQDANRAAGFREVKTPGEKGKKTVTYEIEMKNGKEISRKEIQSIVTKEPKKQVEIVGAKFNYTGGPLNEAQINALGMCESGMTATRNSGNGFYGAFQFMPSTWSKVAPAPYNSALPHEAPLDAQKQAVQNLLSRSSIYTQFPGCAKKMQASGVL